MLSKIKVICILKYSDPPHHLKLTQPLPPPCWLISMSNRNFYLTTKFGQRKCSVHRKAGSLHFVNCHCCCSWLCFSLSVFSFSFSLTLSVFLLWLSIYVNFVLTENLALKKTAAQSSSHNVSSGPENAVDGNRNPLFDVNGNCALTKRGDPSWWRVDLGTNRVPVSDVLIVNRLLPRSALQSNGYYKITLGET